MKTIKIHVDYPSCKESGFFSDDFITEVKTALSGSDYDLSFNATADDNKNYYAGGISKIEYSGDISPEEVSHIQKVAATIFIRLKEEKAN